MNKESKYKANCDNDKCDEHAEFKPPTSLVQVLVELDEDDAVGDQGDEDQADHGETPGFKSCQTFRYQRDLISCQRQSHWEQTDYEKEVATVVGGWGLPYCCIEHSNLHCIASFQQSSKMD